MPQKLAVNSRPPSSLEVDWLLSGAGAFLLPAATAVGGVLGGGGGGVGTPTGGGGGGGAPPPFIICGAGAGGASFITGSGGGGRAAAAPFSSFSGSGGTFIFDFGCHAGKSSYSTIFFFGFLFDEGAGSTLKEGEGLLGLGPGGKGGSAFSVS